jgi:hypothetical protein
VWSLARPGPGEGGPDQCAGRRPDPRPLQLAVTDACTFAPGSLKQEARIQPIAAARPASRAGSAVTRVLWSSWWLEAALETLFGDGREPELALRPEEMVAGRAVACLRGRLPLQGSGHRGGAEGTSVYKELDCMEVLGEWVPVHRPPDLSSLPPKAALQDPAGLSGSARPGWRAGPADGGGRAEGGPVQRAARLSHPRPLLPAAARRRAAKNLHI